MNSSRPYGESYGGANDLLSSRRSQRRSGKRPPAPRSRRPRRGVFSTIVQVFGELLLTLGVILMLFVVWELGVTNLKADDAQAQAVKDFSPQVQGPGTPQGEDNFGPAPTGVVPNSDGSTFGLLFIPRFGPEYKPKPLIQGTSTRILDTYGLGHYSSTSPPGQVGNFAVAGHRQTRGAVLDNIDKLQPGDPIFVMAKDDKGETVYYRYRYRNSAFVLPTVRDVLAAQPALEGAPPQQPLLTLTTCNPRFGTQERLIAYASLESWRSQSQGPPAEIADQIQQIQGK